VLIRYVCAIGKDPVLIIFSSFRTIDGARL